MKKLLLTMTLLGTVFTVSACSGNKDVVSDESSELLAKPEVTQAATKEGENFNDNSETDETGKYEKIQYGIYELYFPIIKESDKIRGVEYLYDAYFAENVNVHKSINRPEGTSSVEGNTQLSCCAAAFPEFAVDSEEKQITRDEMAESKNELIKTRVARAYRESDEETNVSYERDEEPDRNKKMKNEFKHVDVQAVSFALYESFYETIPNLTVNVYGMSYSTWNKYMPEDDVYSINDSKAMMTALAENNYSDCDKLASRKIDKSGVYYMDYSEYNKDNRYKQLFIVAEFDEMPIDYAVAINDDMNYNISNSQDYAKWKENNKDKFIE